MLDADTNGTTTDGVAVAVAIAVGCLESFSKLRKKNVFTKATKLITRKLQHLRAAIETEEKEILSKKLKRNAIKKQQTS